MWKKEERQLRMGERRGVLTQSVVLRHAGTVLDGKTYLSRSSTTGWRDRKLTRRGGKSAPQGVQAD